MQDGHRLPDSAAGAVEESIHATVSLPPISAAARPAAAGGRTSSLRLPGGAVRREQPPVPPPRPESTFSPWTRDLVESSSYSPSVVSRLTCPPTPPNISLTTPRPGTDRSENLYVDAPLKSAAGFIQLPQSSKPSRLQPSSSLSSSSSKRLLSPPASVISVSSVFNKKQNCSDPGKKSPEPRLSDFPSLSSSNSSSSEDLGGLSESIFCSRCGRCKCAACRAPRRLPERWLCGDKCHLSADTFVDTVSCMWLVKAVMYHLGKDLEESDYTKNAFDEPCSCSADHTVARWSCVAASSLALPCLCCYLPLRGCVRGAEAAYQRATAAGCKCDDPGGQRNSEVTTTSTSTKSSSLVIQQQPVKSLNSSAPSSPPMRKQDSEKRLLG